MPSSDQSPDSANLQILPMASEGQQDVGRVCSTKLYYSICMSHDSRMWMYATNYLDRKFSRLRLPKRGSNTSRLRRKRYFQWSNRCSSVQWSFISSWVCSGGRNNRPRTHQMGKFPLRRVPPQTSSLWEPRWISTCSSRNRSVWPLVSPLAVIS